MQEEHDRQPRLLRIRAVNIHIETVLDTRQHAVAVHMDSHRPAQRRITHAIPGIRIFRKRPALRLAIGHGPENKRLSAAIPFQASVPRILYRVVPVLRCHPVSEMHPFIPPVSVYLNTFVHFLFIFFIISFFM